MHQLRLPTATILIVTLSQFARASVFLMPMDGIVNGIMGYPGLVYQAIRYEPLCGNLGADARFSSPLDMTDYCIPAMEAFGNNTEDTLALYDTTGSRLNNARVGGGYDVCLCFAVSQIGDGIKGNLCIWVDGTGRGQAWINNSMIASNYRPDAEKTLPFCKDMDVSSMREEWSATAFQPSFAESRVTLPEKETTTEVSISSG
jgi:hypothetical protein